MLIFSHIKLYERKKREKLLLAAVDEVPALTHADDFYRFKKAKIL
jgi:hypothetical protein